MEAEVAKQVPVVGDDTVGSVPPLEFVVDGYAAKLTFQDGSIVAKAYSEVSGRLFEATIQDKDLVEFDKSNFGDCEGVYEAIEEYLREKHPVQFSDSG